VCCDRLFRAACKKDTWLEIGSRRHVYSPRAADLVAIDDLAHGGDATRFTGTDFLPAEARWIRWKTFSYLEVSNNEGER